MKGRLIPVAMLAALIATPTLACSDIPGSQEQATSEYLSSVTAVYRAVAEDFSATDPRHPGDNFSVRLRPVDAIWGTAPTQPVQLDYTAGACVEWMLWDVLDRDEQPLDGRRYLVFVAPQGERDVSYLRVVPDDNLAGVGMMSAWSDLRTLSGTSSAGDDSLRGPSGRFPVWLVVGASSLLSLFIGILVGRLGRGPRNKQRQNS